MSGGNCSHTYILLFLWSRSLRVYQRLVRYFVPYKNMRGISRVFRSYVEGDTESPRHVILLGPVEEAEEWSWRPLKKYFNVLYFCIFFFLYSAEKFPPRILKSLTKKVTSRSLCGFNVKIKHLNNWLCEFLYFIYFILRNFTSNAPKIWIMQSQNPCDCRLSPTSPARLNFLAPWLRST